MVVCVEFSKAITGAGASWGIFMLQLEYKPLWRGGEVQFIKPDIHVSGIRLAAVIHRRKTASRRPYLSV